MSNRKNHLTIRLRELGGVIRAAGDLAREEKAKLIDDKHVKLALIKAKTLEGQMASKYIERAFDVWEKKPTMTPLIPESSMRLPSLPR